MRKIILIAISLVFFCVAKSQTNNCVATTCSHSLPYTQTTDTIFSQVQGFTPSQYVWTIASGPGVLGVNGQANMIISQLQPGKSTNVNLTVIGSNGNVTSSTTISVAPAPTTCPVTTAYTIITIVRTDSTRTQTILK